MYNPELARYMQPDPIGVNGGMNIYSYVENNPLNMNDPLGLWESDPNGINKRESRPKPFNEGWTATHRFGGKLGYTSEYERLNYFTSNGSVPIEVDRLILGTNATGLGYFKNRDASFNCHGLAFIGEEQYNRAWLENHLIPTLLFYDYREISNPNQLGDIAVFIQLDSREHIHSARLVDVQSNIWISKDGSGPIQNGKLDYKWKSPYEKKFFRRKY